MFRCACAAEEEEQHEGGDLDGGDPAIPTEKDAAVQFAGDLRPWATALGGIDEVSPDDWRPRRGWGSRLSPTEIGEAAQQASLFHLQPRL